MALVVEHDKRKHEILAKALDVFIEDGYEDVTFQKIADRCGITRTTLYIYFKNKREIFLFSIKQLLSDIDDSLQTDIFAKNLSAAEKLRRMLFTILDACAANKKLFQVLLAYLIQLQKSGKDPNERVRRRVVKLRHTISSLIIQGIGAGELKSDLNVKAANDMLYGLIESAIFRVAVLGQNSCDKAKASVSLALNEFRRGAEAGFA